MLNQYFNLENQEKREILIFASEKLAKPTAILEKDLWVTWTLNTLFEKLEDKSIPLAFKGGTSLSKVFNAIDRFSEDIDLALDYRYFNSTKGFDIDKEITRSQSSKLIKNINKDVKEYRDDVLTPFFEKELSNIKGSHTVIVDETGEKMWIDYETVFPETDSENKYMPERVFLELGGRNKVDPTLHAKIKPYVATAIPDLVDETPNIIVLDPRKTFWEKITLIHVANHREGLKQNMERLSRHWFDIFNMFTKNIGKEAINDMNLLKMVIRNNEVFYKKSYSNYDKCLNNDFILVPRDKKAMEDLERDYHEMIRTGFIYGKEIPFKEIMKGIQEIENILNKK